VLADGLDAAIAVFHACDYEPSNLRHSGPLFKNFRRVLQVLPVAAQLPGNGGRFSGEPEASGMREYRGNLASQPRSQSDGSQHDRSRGTTQPGQNMTGNTVMSSRRCPMPGARPRASNASGSFPIQRSAASILSAAVYSQISSRSKSASTLRTYPLRRAAFGGRRICVAGGREPRSGQPSRRGRERRGVGQVRH
jgi:hypothetical protein